MSDPRTVIVRAEDAEIIDLLPDNEHILLADGNDTDGALSSHRVRLNPGGNGAVPHRHDHASEVFYVIAGRAEILSADRVLTAGEGDFIMVPPGTPHAFAAAEGEPADLLIMLTPGIQRFGYFRHVEDIRHGRRDRETLQAVQDRYDTHFLTSEAWNSRR